MEHKQYDVVVGGYLGVDLAPAFMSHDRHQPGALVLRPGTLTEVGGLSVSLGGVVANTGMALRRFGQRVLLMGLTGDDFLGMIARKILDEHGLSEGIRTSNLAGTAYGIVLAPPGCDRIFFESPGCNKFFTSDDIDYRAVGNSMIFHFGYPPLMEALYIREGEELQKMLSHIKSMGVLTSLDMTLPDPESDSGKIDWKRILENTLPFVDIFTPSIEECVCMMRPELYRRLTNSSESEDILCHISDDVIQDIGQEMIEFGANIVFIKAGEKGAYLFTSEISSLNDAAGATLLEDCWKNRAIKTSAFNVERKRIKNASGAGDVAAAGFLTSIIQGQTPEKALRYAMCAGRNNLYGMNATDGLSDWDTMTREIELE